MVKLVKIAKICKNLKKFHQQIVIKNVYQKLSAKIVIENCHQKLSSTNCHQCLKGHRSLGSLFNVKQTKVAHSVSESVTRSHIELSGDS